MLEFYWEKLYYSYFPVITGSELYKQLGVSINRYDVEDIEELISEIEQVLNGYLVQTDFLSGELSDVVIVSKEESKLYPDFKKDFCYLMPTKELLYILCKWRDFISKPPLSKDKI